MKNKKPTAFSLIELSVVILVIGILIAGVIQGSKISYKFRLSSAKALTQGSDVNSIKNLVLWFDATRSDVLTNTNNLKDVSDGDYIKNWHEVNPQLVEQLDFATSASGTYPVYRENAMNGLPTLSFDGVDDYLAVASNVRINDVDNFSIFVVTSVATNDNSAGNIQGILTKLTGTDLVTGSSISNPPYGLKFSSGSSFTVSIQNEDGNGEPTTPSYTISDLLMPKVLVATVTNNSSFPSTGSVNGGIRLYINGNAATPRTARTSIANVNSSLKIGQQKNGSPERFTTCYISEIIFYNRVLTTEERQLVEKYLAKKWKVTLS